MFRGWVERVLVVAALVALASACAPSENPPSAQRDSTSQSTPEALSQAEIVAELAPEGPDAGEAPAEMAAEPPAGGEVVPEAAPDAPALTDCGPDATDTSVAGPGAEPAAAEATPDGPAEVTALAELPPEALLADAAPPELATEPSAELASEPPNELPPCEPAPETMEPADATEAIAEAAPEAGPAEPPCVCGDGSCEPFRCGERWSYSSRTCATDCAVCGDWVCDPGEGISGPQACLEDCCVCGDGLCQGGDCAEALPSSDFYCSPDCDGLECGDGECAPGEDPVDCPEDCQRGECGNLACEPGEDAGSCPGDCPDECGDCTCGAGESYATCPVDAGFCGDGYCVSACAYLLAEDALTCPEDCLCEPDCQGRECGPDGCGGACGWCGQGLECDAAGWCVEPAAPEATGPGPEPAGPEVTSDAAPSEGAGPAPEAVAEPGQGEPGPETLEPAPEAEEAAAEAGSASEPQAAEVEAVTEAEAATEIETAPEVTPEAEQVTDPACQPRACSPEDNPGLPLGPCETWAWDQEACACVPVRTPSDAPELCNAADDDCDGEVDEGDGLCPPFHQCQQGACTWVCQAACEGLVCGDDGCGGACGTCAPGTVCSVGECVPGLVPGFVRLNPGGFWMGSPGGNCPQGQACPPDPLPPPEFGRGDGEVLHYVFLSVAFEVQSHEVTRAAFRDRMGYDPSLGSACVGDCPVDDVSWHQALAYANALSDKLGLPRCFTCAGADAQVTCGLDPAWTRPQDCPGFRLPTEAEWEYAARAGSSAAFPHPAGGDGAVTQAGCKPLDPALDAVGWYCGNDVTGPRPVAGKAPNAWGLHDLAGNLAEWTWDIPGDYSAGTLSAPLADPTGEPQGSGAVVRGGGWRSIASACRVATRLTLERTTRGDHLGFRLVRTAPPAGDLDADGVGEDGDGDGVAGDHPCTGGQVEACDDNCPRVGNPSQADADRDGYGDACDCDPYDASIHPGALVTCNGLDDDCDGLTDEGAACADGMLCLSGACRSDCTGQPDYTPCTALTFPDRGFDVCLGGRCESPGCGDDSCNAPGPDFTLPDTGQSHCQNGMAHITCPGTFGSDHCADTWFCGQDAQYGWDTTHQATERFDRREPVAGQPVVADAVTSLQWMGCVHGRGGSDCTLGASELMPWAQAVATCEALEWGGLDDWRLPSMLELRTLVDHGRLGPCLDSQAFPETASAHFWTIDSVAGEPTRAWDVEFYCGTPTLPERIEAQRVRCVRLGAAPQPPRFTRSLALADQPVVQDALTGLEWQGCTAGEWGEDCARSRHFKTWALALDYCQGLDWGGHTDWYLPDVNELQSLVDLRHRDPAIDAAAFPNTHKWEYWSSTPYGASSNQAWHVGFGNGSAYHSSALYYYYTRCARRPAP
jgi:formylglycine-generating enzyme required for sulfatase activity